jgi:hypothetical protein
MGAIMAVKSSAQLLAGREELGNDKYRRVGKNVLSAGSYEQPDPSEWSNKGVSRSPQLKVATIEAVS